MTAFKNKVSQKLSMHGWTIFRWLKGQKKTAITGAIIFLTWALVNNQVISMETAITLAGMGVTALLAVLEFYFKEVDLDQ